MNDYTYTGPPLSPAIFDILLRFRARKFGLVANIEKAFLNVTVNEGQRNLMRFLWIDDVDKEDPNLVVYRFCRVIFGMNCSPFLLNATLNHHVTEYFPDDLAFAERVSNDLYVDACTTGGGNDVEALKMYRKANACFTAGNSNLRSGPLTARN